MAGGTDCRSTGGVAMGSGALRRPHCLIHYLSASTLVLTTKFGKPKVIIGLESVSASELWNQPMGVVKSPATVLSMESDQLKGIYPEESEFNKDA
uniref:Uncharacterized protein n=1 Tax=Oryza glaberrima TaxID=4538 RepID=I1R0K2_ORYGL